MDCEVATLGFWGGDPIRNWAQSATNAPMLDAADDCAYGLVNGLFSRFSAASERNIVRLTTLDTDWHSAAHESFGPKWNPVRTTINAPNYFKSRAIMHLGALQKIDSLGFEGWRQVHGFISAQAAATADSSAATPEKSVFVTFFGSFRLQ